MSADKIDSTSPAAARLLELYRGRETVHAVAHLTDSNGERKVESRPVHRSLTLEDLERHLKGELVVGVYPIRSDSKCLFAAIDVDAEEDADHGLATTRQLYDAAVRIGFPEAAMLITFSGRKGHHLDVFFTEAIPAGSARLLLKAIEAEAGFEPDSFELFPKQDGIEPDVPTSLGNLIKLPLAIHPLTGKVAAIVTAPRHVEPAPAEAVYSILAGFQPVEGSDAAREPRGPAKPDYVKGHRTKRVEQLAGILNREGVTVDAAQRACLDENQDHFDPPLSVAKVEETVRGIYGRYADQHRKGPEFRGGEVVHDHDGDPQPASAIAPVRISWLWEHRIPLGMFGLLDGDPDLGKSLITYSLIASITTGRAFPDGTLPSVTGNALIYSAEDAREATIIPRLIAADADLERVFILKAVDYGQSLQLPADIARLEQTLRQTNAVFAVFDPWEIFLTADIIVGREQREALEPVQRLFAATRVAALGLRHLNQQSKQKALYRGRGDITTVAITRFGYLVGNDERDETGTSRVFSTLKGNLAPDSTKTSLKYQIAGRDIPMPDGQPGNHPCILWSGQSELSADDLVNPKPRTAGDVLREVIVPQLEAEGPMPSEDGFEILKGYGVSTSNISRALGTAGVKARKERTFQGTWWWSLPDQPIPGDPDFEPRARARDDPPIPSIHSLPSLKTSKNVKNVKTVPVSGDRLGLKSAPVPAEGDRLEFP